MSGVRYSEQKKKKIRTLYEKKDMSAAAIARMDDMPTEKTIRKILTDQGVQLRGNPKQYDWPAIKRDLKKMSVSKAAQKHGCSQRYIYKMKKDEKSA